MASHRSRSVGGHPAAYVGNLAELSYSAGRPTPLPLPVREGGRYSFFRQFALEVITPLPHREGLGVGLLGVGLQFGCHLLSQLRMPLGKEDGGVA